MAAPIGNVNALKNKPFAEAINRAIAQDDGKRLRAIAEALLTKAADGDISAIKEFADRIDGKATQSIQAEVDGKLTVEIIRFTE
jgi:hypothetical protein